MRASPTAASRDTKHLRSFLGLNNTADPTRGIPASPGVSAKTWQLLQQADNVDITDEGAIGRRDGYRPFLAGDRITGSFTTFDFTRFYIIDNGALKQVHEDGTAATIHTGLPADQAFWTELNDIVYLSCGSEMLRITKDGVVTLWGVPIPDGGVARNATGKLASGVYQVCFTFIDVDGREGGASPHIQVDVVDGGIALSDLPTLPGHHLAIYITLHKGTTFNLAAALPPGVTSFTYTGSPLGRDLLTQFLDVPPPTAEHITAFASRLYAAEYLPEHDATVVWFSEPLGYHLFNLNDSFFMVPGRVTQMGANPDALMLSTETRVFLYNQDGLSQVAEYGSVPGQHVDLAQDGKLYFWTKRGLCRTSPFENLTESDVSVAPGVRAAGGLIQQYGYTRFVVSLHSGGAAFNKR